MRQAGSPLIDPDNIYNQYLEHLANNRWEFPTDFDPSGVSDYQIVYSSIMAFLVNNKGSTTYLKSLCSELEKYLQWSFRVCNKSPFTQTEQDITDFFEFVKSPPASWVSIGNQKKFIIVKGKRVSNSKWKPFRAPRGAIKNSGTIKKSYTVLSSYFSYALKKKHIKVNPLNFIHKNSIFPKDKTTPKYEQKILFSEDRELLEKTLNSLVEDDEKYTRENLIILMMLNMYLRISDLAEYKGVIPVFGDFYYKRQSGWWFDAYGKGNKVGDITVNSKVVEAMKAYRRYRGLPSCPYASEETPIIVDRNNKKPIRTTSHIAAIIKGVMALAIDKAIELKWEESDISRLKSFSSHWLRHTGISDGILSRPVEHVRKDARHASFQTTSLYMDSDERARHESSQG